MHDITPEAVVIGIDTHKDVHVAVAINGLGARLATASFPVTSEGYRQVVKWAAGYGNVHAFGNEGLAPTVPALHVRWLRRACASSRSAGSTGSFDAGMARPTPWMPNPPHGPFLRVMPIVNPSSAMASSK